MKITSSNDCGGFKPPKGHLDTQMYPECEGTPCDRDVVKMNRKRNKKDKNKKKNKKTAQINNIDKNTLDVGKINTLIDATRLCKGKHGKLPRVGYEMIVDSGIATLTLGNPAGERETIWSGENDYEYTTYLTNESGILRVWTHINVNPISQSSFNLKKHLTINKK